MILKPEPSILTGAGKLFEQFPEQGEAELKSASARGQSRPGVYKSLYGVPLEANDVLLTEPGVPLGLKRWESI